MANIVDFPTQGVIGVSLVPRRYDLVMYQGDTFEVILKFTTAGVPTDLTGITYASAFKGIPPRADPITQPVISAVTPTNGQVKIFVADTSGLSGEYRWDLQLINGSKRQTYIGGKVTITPDVTP